MWPPNHSSVNIIPSQNVSSATAVKWTSDTERYNSGKIFRLRLATLLEPDNNQIFTVNFRKIILFYLWLIVCIKVGNNGVNSVLEASPSYFCQKIYYNYQLIAVVLLSD